MQLLQKTPLGKVPEEMRRLILQVALNGSLAKGLRKTYVKQKKLFGKGSIKHGKKRADISLFEKSKRYE
jgi:hypothetical protein